jgi:hypothetical protein
VQAASRKGFLMALSLRCPAPDRGRCNTAASSEQIVHEE